MQPINLRTCSTGIAMQGGHYEPASWDATFAELCLRLLIISKRLS